MTCESKAFYYPDQRNKPSHRMCSSGQRRAAVEAWNMLVPGGEIGKDETFKRAARAEEGLARGASVRKHDLISYVVAMLFINGRLGEVISEQGDYTYETHGGKILELNVFKDIEEGRKVF